MTVPPSVPQAALLLAEFVEGMGLPSAQAGAALTCAALLYSARGQQGDTPGDVLRALLGPLPEPPPCPNLVREAHSYRAERDKRTARETARRRRLRGLAPA